MEKGSEFGLGGAGDDFAHDLAEDIDGAVRRGKGVGWRRRIVWGVWASTEVVVASGAGSSFGRGEVGGVAVDVETHVAGDIAYGGVGMGGAVVEKLGESF